MPGLIHIAPLRIADIEAAFQLGFLEGWNQTRSDWVRLLTHQPKGCFGAYSQDRLVGTVTTSIYGREVAWLGMMLVQREYRRLGIGRELMFTALEYARAEASTIKLDATPAGRRLYEALGFVPEAGIERWERRGTTPELGVESITAAKNMISEICELDRLAFGADRITMLDSLSQQSCAHPLVMRHPEGSASGYAMARFGSRAMYIGPIVSVDPARIPALVNHMFEQLAGRAIFVDFYRGCAADSKLLSDGGFAKQRDLTRMYWGKPSCAGLSPSVFSIAGPEIG